MKRLLDFMVAFVVIVAGFMIIKDKVISGTKGAPDLYVGGYAYIIGGIFITYGVWIMYILYKGIDNE